MANLLVNWNFSQIRGDKKSRAVIGASGDLFYPFGWFWRDEPNAKTPWCPDYTSGWKTPEYQQAIGKPPFVDETGWIAPPATIQYTDWTPSLERGKKKDKRPFRLEYKFAQGIFASGAMYDGGFYQAVNVNMGDTIQAGGRVHAWANRAMEGEPGIKKTLDVFHSNDPNWTTGIGEGAYRALAPAGWPNIPGTHDVGEDAQTCIVHRVGIDPTGGTNWQSPSIVWGAWTILYNRFDWVEPVSAVAQAGVVTIWFESACRWPFSNNPSYWSEVWAEVDEGTTPEPAPVPEPAPAPVPEPAPGVDYVVVVNLLPQDATKAEKVFVLDAVHESKQTILQSADDAKRLVLPGKPGSKVVAWGAARWPGDIAAYLAPCAVEKREFL